MAVMLLGAFAIAALTSAILSLLATRLLSWFRSGERKPGDFRPDQSAGSDVHRIEIRGGKRPRVIRARSSELPLAGGIAMVLGLLVACVATGFWMNFTGDQWLLVEILLLSTAGYAIVGLIDDMRKVYRGEGISEIQKAVGVILVSGLAAVMINRLIIVAPLTARLAYPPFSQTPIIGSLLVKQHFAWVIFFLLMTTFIATVTALAVDFADGMDGLAGGLLFSAALAYAVILFDQGGSALWPLIVCALALAGATAGYLPFNWPSPWKGGAKPKGRRVAKLIMGDTGSLALGGLLALIAIIARQELILIIIGGAFVLEGLSAVISARILVKFYRRFLFVERFNASKGFPHTELPLPFLATPLHYHYDLLNIDRRRLVYGAWLLGAGLAILGIASAVGPFTWERYLARLAGLVVLIAVWQAGPWTKTFFIGLARANPAEPEAPRALVLCHGAPFRLFGLPLYRQIDAVSITDATLQPPVEAMLLWQRLSVFDARALLGYYCFREGQYEDALRIWDRLPDPNIAARPELQKLITEATHAVALATVESAQGSRSGRAPYRSSPPAADPLNASSSRMPAPPRLEPSGQSLSPGLPGGNGVLDTAPLWRASVWAAASGAAAQEPSAPLSPANGANGANGTARPFGAPDDATPYQMGDASGSSATGAPGAGGDE